MKPALIVHGGAWDIPDEAVDACKSGCQRALGAGWTLLTRGGSALDAVEAAVMVLEDDPVFDAGYGSHLNLDGRVECDAIVMNGDAPLRRGGHAAARQESYSARAQNSRELSSYDAGRRRRGALRQRARNQALRAGGTGQRSRARSLDEVQGGQTRRRASSRPRAGNRRRRRHRS